MPKRRVNKSPATEKKTDEDDDDFFFDDCQSNSSRSGHEPQQRNAANARERARMRVLSKAFCRLKTTLPWVPADTKLSKLDTLRLAASYIAHLRALLNDEPRPSQIFSHPFNLAWPFAFQHGGSISCVTPRWNITQVEEGLPDPEDFTKCHQRTYPETYSDCQDKGSRSQYDMFNHTNQMNERRCYSRHSVDVDETVQYSSYDCRENYYEELRASNYN